MVQATRDWLCVAGRRESVWPMIAAAAAPATAIIGQTDSWTNRPQSFWPSI